MTSSAIMGLDLSLTSTGVSLVSGDEIETRLLKAPKLTGAARLDALRGGLNTLLDEVRPLVVAVEGYAFGAKNQLAQIGEWGGVARLALRDAAVPHVLIVPPSSL